jgi:hypothetical protein
MQIRFTEVYKKVDTLTVTECYYLFHFLFTN